MRVAVLVSGNGTNLQALIDHPDLHAQIVLVGCNRADAPAIERARRAAIPVCVVDRTSVPRRSDRQRMLLESLRAHAVDLLVLAGFDEILTPDLVQAYANRLINTHPSLLPAFGKTMHAVQAALDHGVKVTGATVHLVTDDLDGGPILLQACVPVEPGDTEATLHERILEQEHRLLPAAVKAFAEGRVVIEGQRARVIRST
ncbi:MAG TPA: phosphoribosylglycinamide formyltransferase [Chloroflexota bacterium]|nr:phosphoribosylglycinamide formyltransferase [Chloroflexota bacterium]